MIRKEYLLAALLTAAGAAGGYWLLPEEADVARMAVRDYNYTAPKQHYDSELEKGKDDVETVQQLVRINTNTGDVDRAIEVLETYVKEHPEDDKALKQLGELYQFAQRYEDYMAILEARAKEHESPVVLQEMAQLYNFFQQKDKQKDALNRLYLVENGKNPETLQQLSVFAAIDKDYANTAKWLDELLELDPEAYTQDDAIRHVNALLEENRPDDALTITRRWRSMEQADTGNVASLIDMLHYQGDVYYANEMLKTIPEEEIRTEPELLHSWMLVQLATGHEETAYQALLNLYKQDALPDMLVPDLMYMSAVRGKTEQFHALHKRAGLNRLPDRQLASIWLTSQRANQRGIMQLINGHVSQSAPDDYPISRVLILIHERSPSRHAALRSMLEKEMDTEVALDLAIATVEAGETNYTRQFLDKLPAPEKLNDADLVELEKIHLRIGGVTQAKRFLATLEAAGRLDSHTKIGLRTAAAQGQSKKLRNWHADNAKTMTPLLAEDLFYQAANHGHLQLALSMLDWNRNPKAKMEKRHAIADIYTRLGRYDSALNILSAEPVRTEREAEDRIFLLSKLAPTSKEHRMRLARLAQHWFQPKTSRHLKEQIVFSLLAGGEKELAMPYVKQMADNYGGEWLLTYADMAEQQGNINEATQYRLAAADDDSFSAETKMGLAYALADRGHRKEAHTLLSAMAQKPETREAATETLVYLWGVRPTAEQLDWLTARWRHAEGQEKANYAKLLEGRIPPDMIVPYIQQQQDLRLIPAINREYLQALANQGLMDQEIADATHYAQSTQNVEPLLYLADLARNNGRLEHSRKAYDAAYAVRPDYEATLVGATITADAQADYNSSSQYFEQYLARVQNMKTPPRAARDVHEAYFSYAENLRRQNRLAEAQPYYQQTMNLIRERQLHTPRALSLEAQSAAWAGHPDASDTIFEYAFRRFPDNAVIKADKAALKIEQKHYEEARSLLASLDNAHASDPNQLGVPLVTAEDAGSATPPLVMDNGRQMVVHTAPETITPRYWLAHVRSHPDVSYVTEGYDTVLIVTKAGHTFNVSQPNQTGWLAKTETLPVLDIRSEPAQLKLRKELLQARMELETGDVGTATKRVTALEKDYGQDPQFLGFAASTYYYAGNWPAATQRIAQAQSISPNNADIAKLKRDIDRNHADRVRADVSLINRGDHQEIRTELSAETQVSANWRAGGVIRNHNLDVAPRLQPDGTIRSQSGDVQTGEVYGIYTHDPSNYSTIRLFGTENDIGVGVAHTNINRLGITTLSANWHEPYFGFVEGLYDNTVRDRIAVHHRWKPSNLLEIGGGLSYNQYSIDSADDVFTSVGVEANVSYTLQQADPYIGIGYGLDAKYQEDNTFQQTTGGLLYRQLPLRSREIHSGSITVAKDFSELTYGSLLAGYGWDRLGGNGPSIEGQIHHNIQNTNWDLGARAYYGLDTTASAGDDFSILNGYLQYRF